MLRQFKPYKICASVVLFAFLVTSLLPVSPQAFAQVIAVPSMSGLLQPSPIVQPARLMGMKVFPNNPFQFEFVVDPGQSGVGDDALQQESDKLIKYFLASLTTPESDLWVNLSPYEEDRIVADDFGATDMGRDMLAQDYLLKKLASSMIHPDTQNGREFWDRIYQQAFEKYGTTEVPVDTFHKIWIMPDVAQVYEGDGVAYVTDARMKVLMEEDYLAAQESKEKESSFRPSVTSGEISNKRSLGYARDDNNFTTEIMRNVILPEIEQEINEGTHFAPLRQMYHSLILAAWFKKRMKETLLAQVFADQQKVDGVTHGEDGATEQIWNNYVTTFKDGVYDIVKEEYDVHMDEMIPRKYFSGGFDFAMASTLDVTDQFDSAMVNSDNLFSIISRVDPNQDQAMIKAQESFQYIDVPISLFARTADANPELEDYEDSNYEKEVIIINRILQQLNDKVLNKKSLNLSKKLWVDIQEAISMLLENITLHEYSNVESTLLRDKLYYRFVESTDPFEGFQIQFWGRGDVPLADQLKAKQWFTNQDPPWVGIAPDSQRSLYTGVGAGINDIYKLLEEYEDNSFALSWQEAADLEQVDFPAENGHLISLHISRQVIDQAMSSQQGVPKYDQGDVANDRLVGDFRLLRDLYPLLKSDLDKLPSGARVLILGPGYGLQTLDMQLQYPGLHFETVAHKSYFDRKDLLKIIQERYGLNENDALKKIDFLKQSFHQVDVDVPAGALDKEFADKDQHFDMVIMDRGVIKYLHNKKEVIEDMYRILNPDGILFADLDLINFEGVSYRDFLENGKKLAEVFQGDGRADLGYRGEQYYLRLVSDGNPFSMNLRLVDESNIYGESFVRSWYVVDQAMSAFSDDDQKAINHVFDQYIQIQSSQAFVQFLVEQYQMIAPEMQALYAEQARLSEKRVGVVNRIIDDDLRNYLSGYLDENIIAELSTLIDHENKLAIMAFIQTRQYPQLTLAKIILLIELANFLLLSKSPFTTAVKQKFSDLRSEYKKLYAVFDQQYDDDYFPLSVELSGRGEEIDPEEITTDVIREFNQRKIMVEQFHPTFVNLDDKLKELSDLHKLWQAVENLRTATKTLENMIQVIEEQLINPDEAMTAEELALVHYFDNHSTFDMNAPPKGLIQYDGERLKIIVKGEEYFFTEVKNSSNLDDPDTSLLFEWDGEKDPEGDKDYFIYHIENKLTGVEIAPQALKGKGLLTPLLVLFFQTFPEVDQVYKNVQNLILRRHLREHFGFKPMAPEGQELAPNAGFRVLEKPYEFEERLIRYEVFFNEQRDEKYFGFTGPSDEYRIIPPEEAENSGNEFYGLYMRFPLVKTDQKAFDQTMRQFPYNEGSFDSTMGVEDSKGGIDFNIANLGLDIQGDGSIQMNFTPEQIEQLRQNITGFTPVILNIQPLRSLPLFLGLNEDNGDRASSIPAV